MIIRCGDFKFSILSLIEDLGFLKVLGRFYFFGDRDFGIEIYKEKLALERSLF